MPPDLCLNWQVSSDPCRTDFLREGKGDLLANSHSTWNRWQNHFCKSLHVRGVVIYHVGQTALRTAAPLAPEPGMAFENLKNIRYQALIRLWFIQLILSETIIIVITNLYYAL